MTGLAAGAAGLVDLARGGVGHGVSEGVGLLVPVPTFIGGVRVGVAGVDVLGPAAVAAVVGDMLELAGLAEVGRGPVRVHDGDGHGVVGDVELGQAFGLAQGVALGDEVEGLQHVADGGRVVGVVQIRVARKLIVMILVDNHVLIGAIDDRLRGFTGDRVRVCTVVRHETAIIHRTLVLDELEEVVGVLDGALSLVGHLLAQLVDLLLLLGLLALKLGHGLGGLVEGSLGLVGLGLGGLGRGHELLVLGDPGLMALHGLVVGFLRSLDLGVGGMSRLRGSVRSLARLGELGVLGRELLLKGGDLGGQGLDSSLGLVELGGGGIERGLLGRDGRVGLGLGLGAGGGNGLVVGGLSCIELGLRIGDGGLVA